MGWSDFCIHQEKLEGMRVFITEKQIYIYKYINHPPKNNKKEKLLE